MASLGSHVEAARSALLSEDYDATARLCLRILDHFPRHVETYALLAEAYRELGLRDEAEDLFRRVVSADPEHIVARWGLSLLCEARGDLRQAASHIQVAVDLAPNVPALRPELQRLTRGAADGSQPTPAGLARFWSKAGLADRALRAYAAVLESQPHRLDVQVALAELLWRMDEPELASEVARQVVAEAPDCLKANLILARHLELLGRADEAAPHAARAAALDPEGQVAVELFGAAGVRLHDVSLPDAEAGPEVAVPRSADEWLEPAPPPTPQETAAATSAMPAEVPAATATPTAARPAPALTEPDDWMAIDDQELEIAPEAVEMATAEELAAFEAMLEEEAAGTGHPPTPERAAPPAAHAQGTPLPAPFDLVEPPPAADTPLDDWLQRPATSGLPAEPARAAPAASAGAPDTWKLEVSAEPAVAGSAGGGPAHHPQPPLKVEPRLPGRVGADRPTEKLPTAPLPEAAAAVGGPPRPPGPAPRAEPDSPAAAVIPNEVAGRIENEWSALLSEEIELDADQQARLRAALEDAGLAPPPVPAKAPPVILRPRAGEERPGGTEGAAGRP